METIQVKDKFFSLSIPKERIQNRIKQIAKEINSDFKGKNPLFLGVLNGVFMFAADLMKNITIPCEISFIKVASYSGTHSTGNIQELIGVNENLNDRHIIILEDIIDSGNTMKSLLNTLYTHSPKSVTIASLLVKPDSLRVPLQINYRCFDIPNDFILGYGLDYDGEARNLEDIYTLIENKK